MTKTLLIAAIAAGFAFHTAADAAAQRNGPTPARSINAPAGTGIVADPSFEDGTPNSFWAETSTNFGTPLCTVADCGSGTSAAPVRTGLWWAWFGGTASVETGSVSQSVVIPANSSAALTFGFQAPLCVASAAHFVEARINGTAVWRADGTSPLCNQTAAYTLINVDVSAYSGQTVTLSFNSTTDGGTTNFFIDDAQITATANAAAVSAPALSTWGLGGLVLALGLAGFVAVRRYS